MLNNFLQRSKASFVKPGKASFVIGGQWGSEGKGASAAVIADQLQKRGEAFDIYTTNAGAQAGHTSIHRNQKRVVFHLPTAPLIAMQCGAAPCPIYLNAGSIIDPAVLEQELKDTGLLRLLDGFGGFFIHPNAAVIEQHDRDAEGETHSAQTKIASTRKGVGNALSRKVLRSAKLAKDHPYLKQFVWTLDLNADMARGASVLVEIPQGIGLSLNGPFYPHTTSRDCTVMQAMNDAGIHPAYYGKSMLVLRTYPIRVGNVKTNVENDMGWKEMSFSSGGCYPDQQETSWEAIGVPAEITTVTKRIRRVFTFSLEQAEHAMRMTRPDVIHLTFCDYPGVNVSWIASRLIDLATKIGLPWPEILYQYGPSTDDVRDTVRQSSEA